MNTDTEARPSEYTRWVTGEPESSSPWVLEAVSLKPGGTLTARQLDANVDPLALDAGCFTHCIPSVFTRGSTADLGRLSGMASFANTICSTTRPFSSQS